ncbi:MAG TPA: hypothetical protein VFU86_00605, partial [Terriglobales bacterium]|nr:hypothetical protein [Terriglobales bacterium]
SDSIPGAVELSNYRLVDGVMVPFRIAVFENGTPTSVATVSSVVLNIADSSSEFDLPTGGAQ